jgi:FkbM family methyltransferase
LQLQDLVNFGHEKLKGAARLFGVELDGASLEAALRRASARGLRPKTILDVGASDGRWTQKARRHFPDAGALLVEAQSLHEAPLRRYCAATPGVDYILAVAGDKDGEVFFDATDPFGGAAAATPQGPHWKRLPMVAIDAQVAARKLPGPFLLKLDTHGFEVPILEGAKATLAQVELAVIEAYNFQLQEGCLRFHELIAYMEARGFRCIDLCDPLWRRKDGALWQMDLFFVRADRSEFASNAY